MRLVPDLKAEFSQPQAAQNHTQLPFTQNILHSI